MDTPEHPPDSVNEEPLTRQDVEGALNTVLYSRELDFTNRVFESRVDLSGLNLNGVNFTGATLIGARFQTDTKGQTSLDRTNFKQAKLVAAQFPDVYLGDACLKDADLYTANFQRANLMGADLRGANLVLADFREANLFGARLEGAFLYRGNLEAAVNLQNVDWGDNKIGEEIGSVYGDQGELRHERFLRAEPIYRALRYWHTRNGINDRAAEFFYREMECKRKLAWQKKSWGNIVKYTFLWQFGGYGEKPVLIPVWSLAFVLFLAVLSWVMSLFSNQAAYAVSQRAFAQQGNEPGFGDFLYFHLVSFTALGYGGWVIKPPDPDSLMKFFGAFESFVGAFAIGLFIAYVARIWTR